MKKNYILLLAFLISFNAYSMITFFKSEGETLANKCNEYFNCQRANSLQDFDKARKSLNDLILEGDKDFKLNSLSEEKADGLFLSAFKDQICRKAVFEDDYNKEKALACSKHGLLNDFSYSYNDMPYFTEPRRAIEDALKNNKEEVNKFYHHFEWKKLIRDHEYPENQKEATSRMEKYLGLTNN